MKNQTKKIVSACVLLLLLFVFVLAPAGCAQSEDCYVIGLSGPLTGGAAQYGIAVENGANLAVKEINAQGGLFGHHFKVVAYDDKHDSSNVANGYAFLLEKGMQVSLGCVTSAPCAEFKALSAEDNVFFLTPSATNDEIPSAPNGYQMCFADGNQGKAAAKYVNSLYEGQTIGILYASGDNYSEGIRKQFLDNLSENIRTVTASFVDSDAGIDFSSQINTLKDCSFVFMPIYYTPASQFMIQAKSIANHFEIFYGCDGLDGIDTVKGFDISSIPQEISYLSHFSSATTTGAAHDFTEKYRAEYGETPSQFAASAYDCVMAIYNAMKLLGEEKVPVDIAPAELSDLLRGLFDTTFTYSGVTGSDMKWTKSASGGYGYVDKAATKYVVKTSDLDG